jgi:hypothetical protein
VSGDDPRVAHVSVHWTVQGEERWLVTQDDDGYVEGLLTLKGFSRIGPAEWRVGTADRGGTLSALANLPIGLRLEFSQEGSPAAATGAREAGRLRLIRIAAEWLLRRLKWTGADVFGLMLRRAFVGVICGCLVARAHPANAQAQQPAQGVPRPGENYSRTGTPEIVEDGTQGPDRTRLHFKPRPQDDIPGIIEGTPPKDTRRHGG